MPYSQVNSQVVIYSSRLKCLAVGLLLLIPMGIITFPIFLIFFGTIPFPPIIKYFFLFIWVLLTLPLIAFVMLPFVGFCLYRASVHRPAVTLSNEGIYETSWVFSPGLIKWDELSSISVANYGKRWLLLITHDPRPIWDRMSLFSRLHSKLQSVFVQSPFMIPEHLIEGSLDELARKIQTYRGTILEPVANEYNVMICPKCRNRDVIKTNNKWILFISIVAFVIVNILFWGAGLIERWEFILIIVINALLTARFHLSLQKLKCRNCGFEWNATSRHSD
jgi:hypothetical protein